jgi:hypothetical protein
LKSLRIGILISSLALTNLFGIQAANAVACTSPTSTTWTGDGVTGTSGVVYTIRKFLAVETGCTWTIPTGVSTIDVLAVGGGGGAGFGNLGGGGGAGKLIVSKNPFAVSVGSSVTVTVGSGGAGGYNSNQSLWTRGQNGNSTSIAIGSSTYTAIGGGAGNGGTGGEGFTGGSSGGASAGGALPRTSAAVTASDATTSASFNEFGNIGGTAASNGGGGGGAGAAGSGNNGGAGRSYWGMDLAGGGGGWASGSATFGGGAAKNQFDTLSNSGNPGTANTGGGGGGGNAGGSGILVIRYVLDSTAPTVSSFSTTKSDGSYKAGEAIAISATTSESVRSGDSITVTLNTSRTVTLTAASNGTTLSGNYTVQAGDTSSDLTVSSFSIVGVQDLVGNAMTSTTVPSGLNNIGGSKNIVIDTTAPTFSNSNSFSFAENTSVGTNAALFTSSETATISLLVVSDSGAFDLITTSSNSAVVRFKASPDFESPTDSGGDNVYSITIRATDTAGNTGDQAISINVTDVVDTSSFSTFGLPSSATTASFRTPVTISAIVTVSARVTFRLNGMILPGCKNRTAIGSGSTFTATCSWKPSRRGDVTLTATATPLSGAVSSSSTSPLNIRVSNRSGARVP